MYFLFLTVMNLKYIIHSSKRDTHKQVSQRSLKIYLTESQCVTVLGGR
nr:MAG TPA: hypothetical protein [Caudoviricetes sp.]